MLDCQARRHCISVISYRSSIVRYKDNNAINNEIPITAIGNLAIECRRNKPPYSSSVRGMRCERFQDAST